MRIVLETLDGTKYEAEANAATFGCLADRVMFERRFGVSAAVLGKVEQFVQRNDDGSTDIVDQDGLAEALREEHILFLAWRELSRHCEDAPQDFDEVLTTAVGLTLQGTTGSVPEDPSQGSDWPTTG